MMEQNGLPVFEFNEKDEIGVFYVQENGKDSRIMIRIHVYEGFRVKEGKCYQCICFIDKDIVNYIYDSGNFVFLGVDIKRVIEEYGWNQIYLCFVTYFFTSLLEIYDFVRLNVERIKDIYPGLVVSYEIG